MPNECEKCEANFYGICAEHDEGPEPDYRYDSDESDASDIFDREDYEDTWDDDSHLAQWDDDPNPYHGDYSEM